MGVYKMDLFLLVVELAQNVMETPIPPRPPCHLGVPCLPPSSFPSSLCFYKIYAFPLRPPLASPPNQLLVPLIVLDTHLKWHPPIVAMASPHNATLEKRRRRRRMCYQLPLDGPVCHRTEITPAIFAPPTSQKEAWERLLKSGRGPQLFAVGQ